MSMLKSLVLVAVFTSVGGAAIAAPAGQHMTDVQFLQLNRCAGLMSSEQLGGGDSKRVDAVIREQARGRDSYIMQRADQLRDDAARIARKASGDHRAKLVAERDGVCLSLAPSATTTAVAHGPASGAAAAAN